MRSKIEQGYFEVRSGGKRMDETVICKIIRPGRKTRKYQNITPTNFQRLLRLDPKPLIEIEDNTIVLFGRYN